MKTKCIKKSKKELWMIAEQWRPKSVTTCQSTRRRCWRKWMVLTIASTTQMIAIIRTVLRTSSTPSEKLIGKANMFPPRMKSGSPWRRETKISALSWRRPIKASYRIVSGKARINLIKWRIAGRSLMIRWNLSSRYSKRNLLNPGKLWRNASNLRAMLKTVSVKGSILDKMLWMKHPILLNPILHDFYISLLLLFIVLFFHFLLKLFW